MKCLVTGGAGFIGSHLTERLLKEGSKVTIVDDMFSGNERNIESLIDHPNLKFEKRSIVHNLSDLFSLDKYDVVFHVAAIPRVQYSFGHPKKTNAVNVDGTKNLLETAKFFQVPRFVFSSSSSIYGDQIELPLVETMNPNPLSPYAFQKLDGEKMCRDYHSSNDLETISLRYFNVYGPRQNPKGNYAALIPRFITRIRNEQPVKINGDGSQTRDFTYVADVVEANILAAYTKNEKCYGQVFNIGSGKNFSVNEVTKYIKNIIRKEPIVRHDPPLIEPKHTRANITKAETMLNWQPKIEFKQGLEETINYFSNK